MLDSNMKHKSILGLLSKFKLTLKILPTTFPNPPQAKLHNKEKKNLTAKLYRKQYIIQQIS